MGRLCAVPNCPSGHDRDRNRRKRAGLRQASLFSVPKDNNIAKVWSTILDLDLSERHLVCELHFSKDSIKTEDQIRLADGTIHRTPRRNWALKEGAIPVAIAEKENIGCDPGIRNAHKETATTKSVTEVRTFRKEIVLGGESLVPFAATSITNVQTLRREASLVHDTPLAPNEATSSIEDPNRKQKVALVRRTSSSCGPGSTAPVAAASIIDIDFDDVDEHLQSNDDADKLMETSSNISNDIQEHSGLRKEVHHEDDTYDFAGHLMETSVESLSASSEIDGNIGASDDEPMQLLIDDIFAHLEKIPLSKTWCWTRNRKDEDSVVFVKIDPYSYEPTLRLIVYNDLSVRVCTADGKANMQLDSTLSSIQSLQTLLDDVGKKVVCNGTGMHDERRDHHCTGFVRPGEYGKFVNAPRCSSCRKLRRKIQNLNNRRKSDLKTRYARSKHAANMKQRACKRLRDKGKLLLQEVVRAHQQCSAVGEQALHDAIAELPDAQQEAVRACFNAAKVQSNQRRYTLDWVYECLLMRIKNSKLYEHLRSRNILPLPCKDTLNKYIEKLDTSYGFQKPVFDCLKLKSSAMEIQERRGSLLIDEMSLSTAISLDRKSMKFQGFVFLGDDTPAHLQNTRGDHALVFMFQPFRGTWIQVLGCFLSKDSVTSQILYKLILECLLLLERAGFHVDVVTMDGAQWNRGVWTMLGIRDGHFSCEHPSDTNRRLWMISDFPHLMKCFRNGFMKPNIASFRTHHGTVKKRHWETLITHEGYTKPNMSIAYTLTPAHLEPNGYQKMNVPLAFELFSERVRVAMEFYMNDPRCPGLEDAAPTIHLIRVVGNLIRAMMSRKPLEALRPTDTCMQKKAINEFLKYLDDWQIDAKAQGYPFPISASTVNGLKVTLGSTLELLEFLHNDFQFDYLMTARLNQDALERFFGMMRNACGSNDHPDPVLFAQVFRLMCSYSLIKPPKGSNVSGTELLRTLMGSKESLAASQNPKKELFSKLDAVIEGGQFKVPQNCSSAIVTERDHDYFETCSNSSRGHLATHDYDVVKTSEEVMAYIAGYIARKGMRITSCLECRNRLKSEDSCDRDRVIDLMSRFGGLFYPSEELFRLLKTLETAVLDVVGKLTVKENTLHQIVERVSEMESLTLVGCARHEKELTKDITTFYLIMRANFIAKSVNKNYDARKIKTKMNRKKAKL